MLWHSHVAVGANAAWISVLFNAPVEYTIGLAILAGFAALFPDIDGDHAKIHSVGIGKFTPLAIFKGGFKHRGFFHSLLAVVILLVALLIWVPEYKLLIALVVATGYASHLILDGITKSGIRLLFPLKKKYRLLPRALAFRTGGSVDFLLLLLGGLGIVALFWINMPELQEFLNPANLYNGAHFL
jgi:inner membrane protein